MRFKFLGLILLCMVSLCGCSDSVSNTDYAGAEAVAVMEDGREVEGIVYDFTGFGDLVEFVTNEGSYTISKSKVTLK